MNLELTPEQYRKLIELAYLGEWVINSQHDPDFSDDAAASVLQRLLSAVPGDDVKQDAETGQYYMSAEWTDQIFDTYILDYDDHVFWDELTERLAARDLARRRGVSLEDINRDDDLPELRPLEDNYRTELEERGIERLDISEY